MTFGAIQDLLMLRAGSHSAFYSWHRRPPSRPHQRLLASRGRLARLAVRQQRLHLLRIALGQHVQLAEERLRVGSFLRRYFVRADLRCMNLPLPVVRTRLAVALCVLSFCFIESIIHFCGPLFV